LTLLLSKSRFLILWLGVVLIVLATAFAAQARDNWRSIRTKNFLLIGNGSEKEIREVATKLEQFRDVFNRLFTGSKINTPVPTTVIVFKSLSSYKPFSLPNSTGYFQKGDDVNYITLTTDVSTESPFGIIYHEYVHLLVESISGRTPAWFNEGLAEYYSSFDVVDDKKVHLGELLPYHFQTLRENRLLPLKKLFEVRYDSPEYNERSKRGIFYAQSWALVHYLLLGNHGQRAPQLNKFVQLIGANLPIEEAFKQAFQIEMETLESELRSYIFGNTFHVQITTFNRKLEFDREFKVSLLSEAEVEAYLGDLLLHRHLLAEAERRLQRALALDPNQGIALTSLGILRTRQGRFTEARLALQKAVRTDSTNYLAHYHYAYALSREAMDDNNWVYMYAPENAATMRFELTRAIELNPDFPESYALLAFVYMVMGDDLDRSMELLKKAQALSPGRPDLAFTLAQIQMRQKKFDLARHALDPLLAAQDPGLRERAQSLLVLIKNREEQTAQSELERENSLTAPRPTNKDYQPPSELDLVREQLGAIPPGQSRIQGLFNKLECEDNGTAYFFVQAGDRLYKVRASKLRAVKLTTYVQVDRTLTCGQRKSPENVVITFRPTTDAKDMRAKIDGDMFAVDLVPKEFTLKN
jgi:tetratricopeptide (TPR) repeat protein